MQAPTPEVRAPGLISRHRAPWLVLLALVLLLGGIAAAVPLVRRARAQGKR